jgi:hypothetical protein
MCPRIAKQPTLVNVLVDYYFDHSLNKVKQDSASEYYSYTNNELFYNSNNKTIVDLLCTIPDELSNVNDSQSSSLLLKKLP